MLAYTLSAVKRLFETNEATRCFNEFMSALLVSDPFKSVALISCTIINVQSPSFTLFPKCKGHFKKEYLWYMFMNSLIPNILLFFEFWIIKRKIKSYIDFIIFKKKVT